MLHRMDVGLVCPWLVGECGSMDDGHMEGGMDDGHMEGGFQCIK